MTHSSQYATPRRETLNPLRNLCLAYLGEVLSSPRALLSISAV